MGISCRWLCCCCRRRRHEGTPIQRWESEMRELCDELDGSAARIQSIKARGSAFWTIGIVYALALCVRLSVYLSVCPPSPPALCNNSPRYTIFLATASALLVHFYRRRAMPWIPYALLALLPSVRTDWGPSVACIPASRCLPHTHTHADAAVCASSGFGPCTSGQTVECVKLKSGLWT